MDVFGGMPFGQVLNGSGWAVAFWTTWSVARMVYTGKLVPRSTYRDTVDALGIERERNKLLMEQLGKVTDSMEVFEAFVRSLPPSAPLTRQTGPNPPNRGQRGGR
jgi:hypothetical protein